MLELIGFCAVAYLIFKFAPAILEVGFKFAVIALGFLAFIIVAHWFWAVFFVTFFG
jgi:hypothetical protein